MMKYKILIETKQYCRNLREDDVVRDFEKKVCNLLMTDKFAKKYLS